MLAAILWLLGSRRDCWRIEGNFVVCCPYEPTRLRNFESPWGFVWNSFRDVLLEDWPMLLCSPIYGAMQQTELVFQDRVGKLARGALVKTGFNTRIAPKVPHRSLLA